MGFSDSYIDNYGNKYIVSSHGEVFEELPKQQKKHRNMEYDDFYDFDEDDYGEYDEYGCKKKKKRLYEVDKVLGMGSGNTIVEVCIPLCPPAVEVFTCLAAENVIFDVLIAKKEKVFINGRLFKNIPYRTRCGEWELPHGCCSGSVLGGTKCAVAEVPFVICADVPGAKEGNKVVVLDYDVNAVNIPNCGCGCLIKSITEKDCISVRVKVVKPELVHIP